MKTRESLIAEQSFFRAELMTGYTHGIEILAFDPSNMTIESTMRSRIVDAENKAFLKLDTKIVRAHTNLSLRMLLFWLR